MDPEETFIRVQERFSKMLTPRIRFALEYSSLAMAIALFALLVVMHANYVQQPGCSSELSGVETAEAQLVQIKITSNGLWSRNAAESNLVDISKQEISTENSEVPNVDGIGMTFLAAKNWLNWIGASARRSKLVFKSWKIDNELIESLGESSTDITGSKLILDEVENHLGFPKSARESVRESFIHFCSKWLRRISFVWGHVKQFLWSFHHLTVQNTAGISRLLNIRNWSQFLHLERLNSFAMEWLEKRSKAFEPAYIYTVEKGYFLLPEAAKSRHNISTVNISLSATHSCFGNRWQQLLINSIVGYDTILMNSLLNSPGQGYLYNYQTKEFYDLNYAHEPPGGSTRFGDYFVTKCGVLMMSLFVFFTTTMSVSFTLRETQTRMLKFTVQLQHHARHQLPTFQLIFVHVIESLVFVPIMIGILFFLFEFYDDQLLAFKVLVLVWLCELFTLISVRTPISMKFFPRFFLLYFLVFHIYFFSYAYGFSYLALFATAVFMLHLILYFWNRFEVPALQRFLLNRRSQLQQPPDFHITSSTILASTLHITRLNTRNAGADNGDPDALPAGRLGLDAPNDSTEEPAEINHPDGVGSPLEFPEPPDPQQAVANSNPGSLNPISSLLLWILGGASSEGINSFLSMFRDVRDQDQVFAQENQTT